MRTGCDCACEPAAHGDWSPGRWGGFWLHTYCVGSGTQPTEYCTLFLGQQQHPYRPPQLTMIPCGRAPLVMCRTHTCDPRASHGARALSSHQMGKIRIRLASAIKHNAPIPRQHHRHALPYSVCRLLMSYLCGPTVLEWERPLCIANLSQALIYGAAHCARQIQAATGHLRAHRNADALAISAPLLTDPVVHPLGCSRALIAKE